MRTNKEHVLEHLRESRGELDEMIAEIQNDEDFDFLSYYVPCSTYITI